MKSLSLLAAVFAAATFPQQMDVQIHAQTPATPGSSMGTAVNNLPEIRIQTMQEQLGLWSVPAYDYAKCIESCDNQYSACAKNGDAERVKYCSNQHDRCRKACLEHK